MKLRKKHKLMFIYIAFFLLIIACGTGGSTTEEPTLAVSPHPTTTVTPSKSPTSTSALIISASTTPTVEGENTNWKFVDMPDNDVVICGNGSVTDPEGNLLSVDISRTGDKYGAVVYLEKPLTNVFSFAVIIEIEVEEKIGEGEYEFSYRSFTYELHDGIFKIGEIDPVTHELLAEQPKGVSVGLSGGMVFLTFDTNNNELVYSIKVKSFHYLNEKVNCDEIPLSVLN